MRPFRTLKKPEKPAVTQVLPVLCFLHNFAGIGLVVFPVLYKRIEILHKIIVKKHGLFDTGIDEVCLFIDFCAIRLATFGNRVYNVFYKKNGNSILEKLIKNEEPGVGPGTC